MKWRKYALAICLIFITAVVFAGGSQENGTEETAVASATRTVSYNEGETAIVPAEVTRIASGWNAQNSVIAMLGYGDRIVATTDIIKNNEMFNKFVPSISEAELCFTGKDVNKEGIISAAPEVLFIYKGTSGDRFNILKDFGIEVVQFGSNSMDNIIYRTVKTAEILGPDAEAVADEYVKYFERNKQLVAEHLRNLPEEKKVRVYHALGKTFSTRGSGLVQDWMDLAYAVNVAEGLEARETDLEQIVEWNPEVIVTMRSSTVNEILSDDRFSGIDAVKNNRVYNNPAGMFWWCRETSEEAIQFLWLATVLYPEYFEDVDMAEETRYFYKTFYGYDLTDNEVHSILFPQ